MLPTPQYLGRHLPQSAFSYADMNEVLRSWSPNVLTLVGAAASGAVTGTQKAFSNRSHDVNSFHKKFQTITSSKHLTQKHTLLETCSFINLRLTLFEVLYLTVGRWGLLSPQASNTTQRQQRVEKGTQTLRHTEKTGSITSQLGELQQHTLLT